MRRIERGRLKTASTSKLTALQSKVDAAADPKAKAEALWETSTRNKAFEDVQRHLESMATGRTRCMYCEDNQATDIDHFWPKSPYPNKTFEWSNYLLACGHCNSNQKRSQFPLANGLPTLVDPTAQDPTLFMTLLPKSGRFAPTPGGIDTVDVFGLNARQTLRNGRADTWRQLERLVRDVAAAVARADGAAVNRLVREAKRLSFQSVVHFFVTEALRKKPRMDPILAAAVVATQAKWAWAL